jgi:folate-binding protein YgfZ
MTNSSAIQQDLTTLQTSQGAEFSEINQLNIPLTFGNDAEALIAVEKSVAICDRRHWGLIEITDNDRVRFLHNQSTNNIQILQPGQGCDTVLVTSTARTIDLTTVYLTDDAILMLVSPGREQFIMEWLDRFLFPMDRVKLRGISQEYGIFSLIGPNSQNILENLGITNLPQDFHVHQVFNIDDVPVRICQGSSLASPGYTLIFPITAANNLWQKLTSFGCVPLGDRPWEQLRIIQGRPMPGQELTEDYNPLEAGLWQTISFDKGCYIGQETIARLNTYKGVKQELWGLRLSGEVLVGTAITYDHPETGEETKIGELTSITSTEQGYYGLGYVKTKAGGAGLQVKVGEVTAEVMPVPFLCRGDR